MARSMRRGNGSDEVARALVRLNAHVLGCVLALLAGGGLLVATLLLLWQGGPHTGQMLSLLRHFFPGYSISAGGALIGALWAAVMGYLVGWAIGRAYGPWVLRGATRMLDERGSGSARSRAHPIVDLRPLPFATVVGALLAGALLIATNWLWLRYGGKPSPHLLLLRHYLPGYATNPLGSLVGALWLFLYGFAAAYGAAWVYARVARWRARRA